MFLIDCRTHGSLTAILKQISVHASALYTHTHTHTHFVQLIKINPVRNETPLLLCKLRRLTRLFTGKNDLTERRNIGKLKIISCAVCLFCGC